MLQTESHAEKVREYYRGQGAVRERLRIINEMIEQGIFRRCSVTDKLVAFDTEGKEVLYLKNLETPEVECHCDPCGDKACDCYGKRCDFCKEIVNGL